jgi:myosin heavy subunit
MMDKNIDIEQQLQAELSRLKKAIEYIAQAEQTVQQAQQLNVDNLSKYNEVLKSNEKLRTDIDSRISELEKELGQIADVLNKLSNHNSSLTQEFQKLQNDNVSKNSFDKAIFEIKKKQELAESNFNKEKTELKKEIDRLLKKDKTNKLFFILLSILFIITLTIAIVV